MGDKPAETPALRPPGNGETASQGSCEINFRDKMVYPGRPSRGCGTCRARKIKCDQTKPTCLRCTKANRTCTGYRVFKEDEVHAEQSAVCHQRANPSTPPGTSERVLVKPSTSSPAPLTVDYWTSGLMAEQLSKLASDPSAALGSANLRRFFSDIILLPQAATINEGCLTCVPSFLPSLQPSSPLVYALSSLILTFASQNHKSKHVMPEAIDSYGKALQLTRNVVVNGTGASATEIILTIMILSMCEALGNTYASGSGWKSHIQGVTSFIKAQKTKYFEDETSKKLYCALITRSIYTSFENETDIPFTISELRTLYNVLNQDDLLAPNAVLQRHTCRLAEIHLRLRDLEDGWSSSSMDDSIAIIHRVIEAVNVVEHELSKWPESLPQEWNYTTRELSLLGMDLCATTAYIYPSFWVANYWGSYRGLRLFGNSLHLRAYHLLARIVRENPTVVSLRDPECALATTYVKNRDLVNDICASIPYHLGYSHTESGERYYPCEGFPRGKYPRLLSACHIVWPLYISGIVEGIGSAQRLWVARQLHYIGREMSVMQANALAAMVARKASMGDAAS
ncbi:hypothetical protein FQN54_009275 [Arachnomyces sp. PD_36]|nr:hypothetical protein FQN54_009275 [Arachnomyces sp. PD_36]